MSKKWICLLAVFFLSLSLWVDFSSETQEESNSSLIADRVWISHLPKQERDKVSIFLAVGEEQIGLFQHSSMFQGDFDLFQYRQDGNQLQIRMLQNNKKANAKFTAKSCNEKGFDYCLEMNGAPRGPVRYYSRKGWEIDSLDQALLLSEKVFALE